MIQNSAVLIDLNISMWTGRKMDKKVSEEVDFAKNTKVRGGNYHKRLLAGTHKLEELQKITAAARVWHYDNTLPWADSGARLLPMKNFFDYKAKLNDFERQFTEAVESFLQEYPTLVSAAAFQLGDLFDGSEYPEAESLVDKFKFRYVFAPVPVAGDFRIDVSEEGKKELEEQYAKFYEDKLSTAVRDAWDRLHECVKHMSEKLADAPTPRQTKDGLNHTQIFRDSLIDNANELCDLLTKLNVTNDPKLEQARQALESAINGKSADLLRTSDEVRHATKAKVDEILGMF
jgi:hypothetical protein